MLSNIKTLIFLTMTGVFVAGCADIPSDAPVFPDFQSEVRILNAANETALLMQETTGDLDTTTYSFSRTVVNFDVLDTAITISFDTVWALNVDSTDSFIVVINVANDTVFTTTPDSTVDDTVFAVRTRTFKDLLVNTGDLSVSVDGTSIGASLAYEDVTAYLPYPSGVYNITYTATTTRTADIVVTDSVGYANTVEFTDFGAVTVSTTVNVVDVAVSVSENVTLAGDQQSLVILHDDDGGNRISLYHEKFMSETGTGSSLGLVKVINTYSAGGALDVSVVDGANIAVGLEFLGRALDDPSDDSLVENFYSGYAEVPVGASVTVTDGGALSETAALTVTAGKRQSLIIFGTSTGFKLSQLSDK
ncbi:MAG: hypothetical protein IID12_06790 [Candidatus Marinimicrobia bacterium]|nr:hypothetical protein [Candidatus Neomarinimicrobiota bacterium]